MGYIGEALNWVSIGLVFDMMCENGNDGAEYATIATQEDFDKF